VVSGAKRGKISRYARNDGEAHGKEKAIFGGTAADNRLTLTFFTVIPNPHKIHFQTSRNDRCTMKKYVPLHQIKELMVIAVLRLMLSLLVFETCYEGW